MMITRREFFKKASLMGVFALFVPGMTRERVKTTLSESDVNDTKSKLINEERSSEFDSIDSGDEWVCDE